MVLIYDLTNNNYLDFIWKLREEARDKDKVSHGRPVLPLESDSLPPFIYVNLLMGGVNKGFAKIQRYDLRLMNHQDPFGNVINVDDFDLYDKKSGLLLESVFSGLLLGVPTFVEAVNSLADIRKLLNNSESNVDARTCLAVLSLVLAEAAKLELVSCWLNKAFESNMEVRLTSWLLNRINDWGDLSTELLDAEMHSEDADCNFYVPLPKNGWNDDGRLAIGVTCHNIARCLGILRAVPFKPVPMVEVFLSGTALAEVYSVSVVFNGGRSGSVYGTIKIDNGYDTLYIYDRDLSNCEPIESHDTLSLQDPHPKNSILVGRLAIELDLKEGGTDNNEVIKGKMLWDGPLANDRFDTRLAAYVKGKNGFAIVYYTVFAEAIQAVVEATILAKEDHPDASRHAVCVCGKIVAYYRDLAYPSEILQKYYTTMLFGNSVIEEPSALGCTSEFGECKCGQWVKPGENIKLSRSSVAVEVSDALIIKAELKSCNGKPIVTGSMEWVPRELGEFQSIMEGHSDDSHILQVKVKWHQISHKPKQ